MKYSGSILCKFGEEKTIVNCYEKIHTIMKKRRRCFAFPPGNISDLLKPRLCEEWKHEPEDKKEKKKWKKRYNPKTVSFYPILTLGK